MQPGRAQTEQHLPGAHAAAVEQGLALDDADDEAGQVEIARRVEPRHLGRLAAEQRQAVLAAGVGAAADQVADHARVEHADGDVVEEEQRPRALHEDVVDAVLHEVAPDRVVDARALGDLELGADAVGAGDQDPAPRAGALEVEEAAEEPDVADHAAA